MTRKVLIAVKTYPTLSKKYRELVCTAGLDENGRWVRIYPIPYRELLDDQKYAKYQWLSVDIEKNTRDTRPESFRVNTSTIEVLDKLDTKHEWFSRKNIVFKSDIYTNTKQIIESAHSNHLSLVTFKPKEFISVECVANGKDEWSREELRYATLASKTLFDDGYKPMPKIPFDFKITFVDTDGNKSSMIILDWEIAQLYLNTRAGTTKDIACAKVKEKIEGFFEKNDLYLFLGTTKNFHLWASNPFTIIGLFYPPKPKPSNQGVLSFDF